MNIEDIRASAVGNGMKVATSTKWRVVAYGRAADGSWVGVWFAAVPHALARRELMRLAAAGTRAELWRGGEPAGESV